MTVPKYTFLQRDAATPEAQHDFMVAVLATQRLWRNEKSQIMFEVARGDYCHIERKHGLRSLLESGDVLQLHGDLDDSAYDTMWIWLTAAKWKLPRLNPERPYSPPRPAPVTRVGYEFVSARRVQR